MALHRSTISRMEFFFQIAIFITIVGACIGILRERGLYNID